MDRFPACFTRQLTLAWILYAGDNEDRLVPNHGVTETMSRRQSWVNNVMSWGATDDNTNLAFITEANDWHWVVDRETVSKTVTR